MAPTEMSLLGLYSWDFEDAMHIHHHNLLIKNNKDSSQKMRFNQQAFNQFVINNEVIGFFDKPVTLKSGRTSQWYANWRKPATDTFLLETTAQYVLDYCKQKNLTPDLFMGVPEGATPLGLITQLLYAKESPDYTSGSHPLTIGRGKPKEHGQPQDRYFLGNPNGKRIIILEDVTTTGGSLLTTINSLEEAGATIIAAIGLTNRMEMRDDGKSVQQAIEEKGVPYHHLSSALELLPLAYAKLRPNDAIKQAVEAEFKQYGVTQLTL